MVRRLCVLLLCFVAVLPTTFAQSHQYIVPNFWGMVVRDPLYEWGTHPAFPDQINQFFVNRMLDELQAMGVQWVRFEFHGQWGGGTYGSINLQQADYFVDAAHSRGIKVVGLLGTDILKKAPPFLSTFDDPATLCVNPDPWGIGCAVNPFIQAWLERALTIADHYKGRIDAYEVFNEPNFYFALRNETNGAEDEMNAVLVARTITKFFRIVRTNNDTTPILVGGLHPMTAKSGHTDRQYLAALYAAESFQGYKTANGRWPVDGIGYHPYPAEMRQLVSDNDFLPLVAPRLTELLGVLRGYDATAKLWITEIGTRGDPASMVDMERQAAFMRDFVAIIRDPKFANDLGPWFWFKYEDFPSEPWGVVHIPFDNQGAYDQNGTVVLYKPAYTQYRRMALDIQLQPRAFLPMLIK